VRFGGGVHADILSAPSPRPVAPRARDFTCVTFSGRMGDRGEVSRGMARSG
jgi:hypothetical protein